MTTPRNSGTEHEIVEQLVRLTRELADPAADNVILGEGNTSMALDDETMLVKASGVVMRDAAVDDFVPLSTTEVLALIDDDAAGDEDVDRLFTAATRLGRRPSVEALLHAVCLDVDGITAVGHTHPTAVNAILCSVNAQLLTQGSLFPDQIVVLGTGALLIDYVDPGLLLARVVRRELRAHIAANNGVPPKVIYLRNHGMFALGVHTAEVLQITAMAVKSAGVLAGAVAFGGVQFMPEHEVERIHTRPDELFRRSRLAALGGHSAEAAK